MGLYFVVDFFRYFKKLQKNCSVSYTKINFLFTCLKVKLGFGWRMACPNLSKYAPNVSILHQNFKHFFQALMDL